jgi:hypothetical protein
MAAERCRLSNVTPCSTPGGESALYTIPLAAADRWKVGESP